jgi:hypothetical protein
MSILSYEELDEVRACVGCGFCCVKAPCLLVQFRGGEWRGCPYPGFDGNRHQCGFVIVEAFRPGLLKINVQEELAIGEGCCCAMNSWRRGPLIDRTIRLVLINVVEGESDGR